MAALAGRVNVRRREAVSKEKSLGKGEQSMESREYIVIDEPAVRRVPQLLRISDFNSSLMSNDRVERSINMSSYMSISTSDQVRQFVLTEDLTPSKTQGIARSAAL